MSDHKLNCLRKGMTYMLIASIAGEISHPEHLIPHEHHPEYPIAAPAAADYVGTAQGVGHFSGFTLVGTATGQP